VSVPIARLLDGIEGWPPPEVDLDLLINAMWALNYGVALDAYFRGTHGEIDVARTAKQVSRFYVLGIPTFAEGARRPRRQRRPDRPGGDR
jgi:hypothetical protein